VEDACLKLAFIGGSVQSAVGYTHFNASRLDGLFKVVAGCFSRDQTKNEASAHKYGVDLSRCYADWRTLLDVESGKIDAVVILSPTPDHAEMAVAAIDAGHAVICEKALATSSAECQLIQDAMNANGGYLAVTFNYSGYPMVRELREMIAEGLFGKIQQIHVEMPQESFLRSHAAPQYWRCTDYAVPTVSLDLGVHVHHLVDFVTGGLVPKSLVGEYATYGSLPKIVDNVYCLAAYEQNLRVQAWWGKTALGQRNGLRLRVFGEYAAGEWYQMDPEILRLSDQHGGHYFIDRGSKATKIAHQSRYNRFKPGHPAGFVEAFSNLYADFAEELNARRRGVTNKSPYIYGVSHAQAGLKMMEALSNSEATRTWVDF
jgi:predicted dehydrogenase